MTVDQVSDLVHEAFGNVPAPVEPMRLFLKLLIVASILITVLPAQVRSGPAPRETYASAAIDADGNLIIVKTDGRRITIRREREQTAFSTPVLSAARTAVGAQALFANCCTSYDIPLQLVVYADGKVHRFKGVGLPIFQWGFADSGARVAYGQTTVHSGCATHYELRDIASERLIESADVPEPCGQNPHPKPTRTPAWVSDLISKKQ